MTDYPNFTDEIVGFSSQPRPPEGAETFRGIRLARSPPICVRAFFWRIGWIRRRRGVFHCLGLGL